MQIERLLPNDSQIIEKLRNGMYSLSGGTIRIAKGYDGAGQIVKHFIISDNKALEQIKNIALNNQQLLTAIQSLQIANLALGSINLAVSVAGFAIVIRKLNEINNSLNAISNKIDMLIDGQIKILFHQHLVEQTKLFSNIENLQLALEIKSPELLNQSLGKLTESRNLYMSICDNTIKDIKNTYQDISLFDYSVKMAVGSGVAQANALSNQGNFDQASELIQKMTSWQIVMAEKLMQPIKKSTPPIWLGQLDKEKKDILKRVINEQKNVKEGMAYLLDQYRFCKEKNILPDHLPVAFDNEILLVE